MGAQDQSATGLFGPELIETLAGIEHDRWAHWQRYVHDQCERLEDGRLAIPAELAERWTKQAHTSYTELTDDEQESDREQVRRYLPTIEQALKN